MYIKIFYTYEQDQDPVRHPYRGRIQQGCAGASLNQPAPGKGGGGVRESFNETLKLKNKNQVLRATMFDLLVH